MRRPATAARRYAEAAFQIATRDGTTKAWLERVDQLAKLLSDERIARLAGNPALPQAERERLLDDALGWERRDPARNLVRLLLRRGRIRLADGIAAEFHRLERRASGITAATVTSATELSDAELTLVRQRLEEMTGEQIELAVQVDPSLIGGVAVRIGDRMIDASVRGRLQRLRERLVVGAAG